MASPRAAPRRAFTLIELLVVIAIIAVLAVVVVLTLNPAQLLAQGRDSGRLSDADTLTKAVSVAQLDNLPLGNASTVYVSIPDPSLSGAQTSTCASIGLSTSSLPSGWTYQCSSPQNYRNTNGTGWVPVDFASTSAGSPFGSLPVDPINQTSTGLYYTYTTSGGTYEVTANLEAEKNLSIEANSGGQYSNLYQKGTSLTLLPVDYGGGGGSVTYTSTTIPVGRAPYGIAFDSHTNTVWVTNSSDGTVTVINDTTLSTSTYGTGPITPSGIAFDPHTDTMWAVDYSGYVTVFNDATYATTSYSVGPAALNDAFDPHTNTMWVTNLGSNNVSVFNDATYAASTYPTGQAPDGVSFDSHTNTMWVTNHGDNTVTVFNDSAYTTSTYPAGSLPAASVFDPNTNTDWMVNYLQGSVLRFNDGAYSTSSYFVFAPESTPGLFDVALARIAGVLVAHAVPIVQRTGMAYDSHTNSVWVENAGSNTVTQLNDTTYASTTWGVGSNPFGVAFDPHNNTIWVANTNSNTVTELVPSR